MKDKQLMEILFQTGQTVKMILNCQVMKMNKIVFKYQNTLEFQEIMLKVI